MISINILGVITKQRRFYGRKEWRTEVKTFYKKLFAFVAMFSVVALWFVSIKASSAAAVTPTITNLKADTSGQRSHFLLTGI